MAGKVRTGLLRAVAVAAALTLSCGVMSGASATMHSAAPTVGSTQTFSGQPGVRVVMTVRSVTARSIEVSVDMTDETCDGYWTYFYIASQRAGGDANTVQRTRTPYVRECHTSQTFTLTQERDDGQPIIRMFGCPVVDRYLTSKKDLMTTKCDNFWV